jgi:Lipocalin-like domain/Glutathione-dependent formaldehyde-activating enzyme
MKPRGSASRLRIVAKTRDYAGRFFCPRCGSSIFARTADEIEVNVGSLDAPDQLMPTYESWSDGHFALFQSRSELPKLAANDRAQATPEEAAAIVSGSIAYYGTYTINEVEKSLSVSLDGSTFANLLGGSAQKRLVTLLNATELQFANPRTPSGMTLQTAWKRPQAR